VGAYYDFSYNLGESDYSSSATDAYEIGTYPAIEASARVGTPALFSVTADLGYGTFSFGQLVNVWKEMEYFTGVIYLTDTYTTYDYFWLDNSFPYPYPNGPWAASSTSQTPGPLGSMDDSPSQGLYESSTFYVIDMMFKTFLMWVPPEHPEGRGVEWAPIHLLEWGWDTGGFQNNGTWTAPYLPDVYYFHDQERPIFELVWEGVYHNTE
jgi:hypothetical protein